MPRPPQGRFSSGAALIDNCKLQEASVHDKHLLVCFRPITQELDHFLHVHLGLYGVWNFTLIREPGLTPLDTSLLIAAGEGKPPQIIESPPRGAVRLRLIGEYAVADLNGPSRCEILTAEEVKILHARLGPDPLIKNSDPTPFIEKVRTSNRTIGELLMDQKVISGVGNIYRAELLFRHRIHPLTPGCQVSIRKLRKFWSDAVVLLDKGKRTGVIVTVDDTVIEEPFTGWTKLAERASDEEADLRWYTYRRNGRPCHQCKTLIAKASLANRTLYWCPRCQRKPKP